MKRIRYDLTDDLCVEAPSAPALFTFTYKGSRAFIVSKGTTSGDVRELFRESVEIFRVAGCEPIGGGLLLFTLHGNKGTRRTTYVDAAQWIADHATIENALEVKPIETPDRLLAVMSWAVGVLAPAALLFECVPFFGA